MVGPAEATRGARVFGRLGRAVVRRPLVVVVGWLVLVAVAAPFLSHLGAVTTNSVETLPSNAPSAAAAAKLAKLFPGESLGASTYVLVTGSGVTGRTGQGLVMNLTQRLTTDPALVDVAGVSSVYTAYAAYLAGQAELGSVTVAAAQTGAPNLTEAVNATAQLLWGPPAMFLHTWGALVNSSGPPARDSNAPAYNATASALSGSTQALAVLAAFYSGYNGSATGFNGTEADCAAAPTFEAVLACADSSARANVGPLSGRLADLNATIAGAAVAGLGIENATSAASQRGVAAAVLATSSGLPAPFLLEVWTAFGGTAATPARAAAWANTTVASATLATEPLPVPLALSSQYVNAAATASLVSIGFTVSDDTTNGSGGQPVYHDLDVIATIVGQVAAASDPTGAFGTYQTGSAPLDQLTQQAVDASLMLVLPLTVGLLLAIAMLYFRSPVAPLVAFAGLGIALLLGIGATVLVGTLVTHVDYTAITLEEVFVLGVGTDYSIFLVARYREELVRGRAPDEAVVAAVTWAGQSVATSGSTAILVTLALAFSGVALLSEWGMVLSVAILLTMLVALTLLPALLRLFGPRVFWPTTGPRFRRSADVANRRAAEGRTYFYRAARVAERRPVLIAGVILAVSVPLVAVALQVPVSYDFYGQLPSGHSATQGLAEMNAQFGPGYAVPSFALVTFAAPLMVGNTSNATEFTDLAALTLLANDTPGIAVVRSPVGPYGASLAAWLSLPSLPPVQRANLLGTIGSYVGTDGRTVLLQLQTNDTGLSFGAVSAVAAVRSSFASYAALHPEIVATAYGGGAPVIQDLADQTDLATEVMLIAVTVGLVLVLLAVLRSWIIALMAVATIGLSISWAWATTDLVFQDALGLPVFFYVRTILIMLVLGLGIDYNIFLLTRVREERLRGRSAEQATVEAVGRTGGIITAAAVILASAFGALLLGEFTLIRAIGFSVAVAVVMDAMVVRTYLVPASLQLLGERVWAPWRRRGNGTGAGPNGARGTGPP